MHRGQELGCCLPGSLLPHGAHAPGGASRERGWHRECGIAVVALRTPAPGPTGLFFVRSRRHVSLRAHRHPARSHPERPAAREGRVRAVRTPRKARANDRYIRRFQERASAHSGNASTAKFLEKKWCLCPVPPAPWHWDLNARFPTYSVLHVGSNQRMASRSGPRKPALTKWLWSPATDALSLGASSRAWRGGLDLGSAVVFGSGRCVTYPSGDMVCFTRTNTTPKRTRHDDEGTADSRSCQRFA